MDMEMITLKKMAHDERNMFGIVITCKSKVKYQEVRNLWPTINQSMPQYCDNETRSNLHLIILTFVFVFCIKVFHLVVPKDDLIPNF